VNASGLSIMIPRGITRPTSRAAILRFNSFRNCATNAMVIWPPQKLNRWPCGK